MIWRKIGKLKCIATLGSFLLTLVLCVTVVFFTECSTEKHYKSLSFFFDGVPDPAIQHAKVKNDTVSDSLKSIGISRKSHTKDLAQSFIHPPYKEKKCDLCHEQGAMGKALTSQKTICYQCHENFSKQFETLHAPVGGGYCTTCHSAHFSDNPNLLKRSGKKLCFYCHDRSELARVELHQQIGDAACTECHNPHGGGNSPFLK